MSSLNPQATHTYEFKVSVKAALLRGDTKELHDLLKQDYSLLNDSFDEKGNTLLMLVANNPILPNKLEVTKYLLNLGASTSQTNSEGRTAVDLAENRHNTTVETLLKSYHSELFAFSQKTDAFIRQLRDISSTEAAFCVEESKREESETTPPPKGPIALALCEALEPYSGAHTYNAPSFQEALFLVLLLDDLHQTLLKEISPDELKTEILRLINDHSDRIGGTSYDYTNTMNPANRLCLALAKKVFPDRRNPWSVLLARSLVQDRQEAWMNVATFEESPPENPKLFYRVRDPRLTTQRDQTKIHVIEEIFDQITPEAIATRDLSQIWKGTDIKGGANPGHPDPLISQDLTLLRQRSPALQRLISYTEELDELRKHELQATTVPNFITAFSNLQRGLYSGANEGGYSTRGGYEAIGQFYQNFFDKLPESVREKISQTYVSSSNRLIGEILRHLTSGTCVVILGNLIGSILYSCSALLNQYEREYRGKAIENPWLTVARLIQEAKLEINTITEARIIAEEPLELILKKPQSLVQVFLDAVTANQVQTVLALLRIFPEYNLMNCQGPLPNQQTALIKAVKAGHLKMVQILLDSGAEINAADAFQSSALSWAVEKGLPMVDLLFGSRLPANSNQINNRGNTPLLAAMYYSAEIRIIQRLLSHGATETIDHRNAQNQSALSWAIQHNRLDIRDLLVSQGASLDQLDAYNVELFLRQELSKRKLSEMAPSHLGLMKKLLVKKREIRPDQLRQLFALAIKKNDTELFLLVLDKRVFDKKVTHIQRPAGFNDWLCRQFIVESTDSEAIAKTLDRLKKLGLGKYKILEIFQTPEENPELETLKHQAIRKILTAKAGTLPDGRPFDKHTSLAVNLFWKDRVFTRKSIEKGTLDALRAILPESRHFDPIVELPVEGPAPLATAAPTPNLAMVLLGAGAGTASSSTAVSGRSHRSTSQRPIAGSTIEMSFM
jgi:ankyrin repeat protein